MPRARTLARLDRLQEYAYRRYMHRQDPLEWWQGMVNRIYEAMLGHSQWANWVNRGSIDQTIAEYPPWYIHPERYQQPTQHISIGQFYEQDPGDEQ